MNLFDIFQNLVAQVPDLVQPLMVALAGAIPFVEGEGAATIGIIAGINPVVAAIAAMAGNFICVALLVLLGSGARNAVVSRRAARVTAGSGGGGGLDAAEAAVAADDESERKRARRQKFLGALERYGVPGVSLLGPLLLPTQFTATMLAGMGIGKARILFWQGLAIIGWTTVIAVIISGAVNAVG